jgi:hypothetical protein
MGPKVLAHFDMVRKLGDANILLYLLLAATRQPPTPDRVIFPRPPELDYRRSCLHCGAAAISAEHVFCCPHVADACLCLQSVVQGNLQLFSSLAPSSDLFPDAHVQWLCNHLWDLVWYEPARQPGKPPPVGGRPSPTSSWTSARASVRDFDRLCGILGFLPPGLQPLLCSTPALLGLRERSHKTLLKADTAALRTFSLDLLRGGLAMFDRWWGASVSTYRAPPSTPSPCWDPLARTWIQFNAGAPHRPRKDGCRPVITHMWTRWLVGKP